MFNARHRRLPTKFAVAIALLSSNSLVLAQSAASAIEGSVVETSAKEAGVEEMYILGVRAKRISKGATGLALEIKDTPQSISVVGRDFIDGFATSNLNDALRLATGVQVEEWETNRSNYMARGLEIKNTQVDGVGLPNNWGIVTGAMDSFGYEKLEVIRGANGLLTGVGNASGTINYVRKRPTNDTQGSLGVSVGSYDFKRVEADYSTPLTDSGDWAGRVVVASEDKDSYLRDLFNDRTFLYGVVDGQLGENATITFGYSYQAANTTGNMWGALVFANSDGTQAEFDTSASTTQDWTMWDTLNETAFVEYTYALADNWDAKLTYNHRDYSDNSKLFYAYTSAGLDKETGLGLIGWPGKWAEETTADLVDITLNGSFSLFGRESSAIFGVSTARSDSDSYNNPAAYTEPAFGALPAFPYAGNAIAEPAWGAKTLNGETHQNLQRIYGATNIGLTDKLTAVVGFNSAEYQRDGQTSDKPFDQTEREFSPYAGLSYQITDSVSGYASYSDIYQPQDYYDINKDYLAASKGVNYELGVKADWLNKRLLTTFAMFTAEQKGLGTYAGLASDGTYYYAGMNVNSTGVEEEITGKLGDTTELILGATSLQLVDDDEQNAYLWVPRETLNLALTTRLAQNEKVQLGISGKWQNDIRNGTVRQEAYATLNTFVRWDFASNMQAQLNINNITDQKYITSLYNVGFYGAPRNASLSVKLNF